MQANRRDLWKGAACFAGTALSGAARASAAAGGAHKLKVLVTGAHPGDPEAGCGGTIARYASRGHAVSVLYLNRGEGYCGGQPLEKCGDIRTAEAVEACKLLHATPIFAGQRDGESVVDKERTAAFRKLFDQVAPDVIFIPWPIDRHPDHRALASLVLDAWLQSGQTATCFYYEVGEDTMAFSPNAYVDITATEAVKRAAFYRHASQGPERWYKLQEQLTSFRGVESGCAQAEAFFLHPQSKSRWPLP